MTEKTELAAIIATELARIEVHINKLVGKEFAKKELRQMIAERMTQITNDREQWQQIPNEFLMESWPHFLCYSVALEVSRAKVNILTGNLSAALSNMTMANLGAGRAGALFDDKRERSKQASVNGSKPHTGNHAAKEMAIKLYLESKDQYKNKDDAAEKISKKVNKSFATVRDWLKGIDHKASKNKPDNMGWFMNADTGEMCLEYWPVDALEINTESNNNPDVPEF